MADYAFTLVWLAGALAMFTWFAVRHYLNPARFETSAERHGFPATLPVALAIFGLTAAIWPVALFLDLIFKGDRGGDDRG